MSRRLAATLVAGERPPLLQYAPLCGGPWALSTYDACDLRCSYCVTYAQGPSVPRFGPAEVQDRIRHELAAVPVGATIGVGALVDAYPHAEAQHGVTRLALEMLAEQHWPVVIVTKGTTITRDIDVLRNAQAKVSVSLCSLDDDFLRSIEPHVAGARARLDVVAELADAGIDVRLKAQPWIPGFTDTEALIAATPPGAGIEFGPLNVQAPPVAGSRLGRMFSQEECNTAYVREMERVGPTPRVSWAAPMWLGSPGFRRPRSDDTNRPGPSAGAQNEATVRRMVDGMNDGSFALDMLAVLSGHIRGHHASAEPLRGRRVESGYFVDVLGACRLALDDSHFVVRTTDARADMVEARIAVTGIFARPLFEHRPTHERVLLDLANRYRFDAEGMIVEMWQDLRISGHDAVTVAPVGWSARERRNGNGEE